MTTFVRPVAEPVEEYQEPIPPSWESHVLIPLTQNLLGGVAVGGLGMIGFISTQQWRNVIWYVDDALLWCSLAGGLVTCLITVIRFFGDDLGLIVAAYRAGQESRNAQINHLELLLRASYDAQASYDAEGATSAIKKNQELMERARKDAATIIKIAFQGDKITRLAMEQRGMGRRDWERATNLLKAAGAMNAEYIVVATTPAQALQAVDEQMKSDVQHGDKFTTKW